MGAQAFLRACGVAKTAVAEVLTLESKDGRGGSSRCSCISTSGVGSPIKRIGNPSQIAKPGHLYDV